MFLDFKNKRQRTEKMEWIYNHIKDRKLRTVEYIHYGIDRSPRLDEEQKRIVLDEMNKDFEGYGSHDSRVEAAKTFRKGIVLAGYNMYDKDIADLFNIAKNTFSKNL